MNLVEFLFAAARESGRWSEPAILGGDGALTYAELFGSVRRFAGATRTLGVGLGDRLAIVAADCPAFVIAFLGTAAAGGVAVPLSTVLSPAEMGAILERSGAKAVVAGTDQAEKLRGIRASLPDLRSIVLVDGAEDGAWSFDELLAQSEERNVEPVDDETLAFLLFTSGSTGRPKGAMHRHRDIRSTCETYASHVLRLGPEDRIFSSSRLFFAYGLGNSLSFPFAAAATSILCSERPTPPVIARTFERFRPTVFFAVPAVYRALLDAASAGVPLKTDSIRFCCSAGERLPARTLNEWRDATGLDLLDGIGSTEMLHTFISNTRGRIVPGSSGTLVPGYEAKLVDADGAEVAGAGRGSLFVRGASGTPGYWNDPETTAATIVDGWVATGDAYFRDEDGCYWHEGRVDDLFKVKGLWVSPGEIEDALVTCPEIVEAAVVAGTDANGLGVAIAYVVAALEPRPDDLVDLVRLQLAALLPPFKRPTEIRFVDTLPRTATGKVQRFKLRDGSRSAV